MGGRGTDSKVNSNQLSMEYLVKKSMIKEIINNSEEIRNSMEALNSGIGNKNRYLYKKCACCREYTIPFETTYETCHICGWIDDDYQNNNPNSIEGRNPISLREAKKIFRSK